MVRIQMLDSRVWSGNLLYFGISEVQSRQPVRSRMESTTHYQFWRSIVLFVAGTSSLALLTYICFRWNVNSTAVGLLFLIVIVLVSLRASFVAAGLVAIFAYLLLDYFFTAPLFTLGMNQTLDYVAPVAYVVIALVIAQLMSRVRQSQENERRAAETLRKAQADLAHVRRVMTMGELAASIAHEINQPLSAIVTNASACLRWLDGDAPNLSEAREAATRIVRDGNRAAEVITRVRGFLRKAEPKKASLDLNETIRGVVALTRREAKDLGVHIQLELGSNLPPVLADRVQLQQVILNLLLNGLESLTTSTNGERTLNVSTREYEADQVLTVVRDNGPGVDSESLEAIFEPFYTSKTEGMGMGLAISRSIIEEHGGRLWATNNSAAGATFQFTLRRYR